MEALQPATGASGAMDFAQGAPTHTSPLSQQVRQPQSARFDEDFDAGQRGSSTADEETSGTGIHRSNSAMSQSNTLTPSRGGTLKKKQSVKRTGGVKRSLSKKGSRPGSVRNLALGEREKYATGEGDEMNSAFFSPVPTTGNPTEILANRFQAWRKVLKDLITYFRDSQKSYEARSKSLLSVSNIINNTSAPPVFLTEGGISDAMHILRDYHKQAIAAGNKAKTIEEDIIVQLTGLRSDLQQKIKEIKNLAGDFKNNVDKETEGTRRAVRDLQEALGLVDLEPSATSGKGDPFIVRLGVERQVERQIDEENYLHRAFLNLENSGRELESIVIGEIQKAYNAYAGILKREADEAYETVERLRSGPVAMAKDHEWDSFVDGNEHFVDPRLPVRNVEHIFYPGKDHPAASEVRAGMLERKSKYLKSYTPGWYVLSPTHLHEFKSADRISSQVPIMSLYLIEQKLGSHSNTDSSSHKFMLKGRQAGGMHRGHAWVFRAESYDTMLAWYEDIKNLTEKTGEERNAFVRRHARSVSGGSHKAASVSSDGALDEDEADRVPYSAASSTMDKGSRQEQKLQERPQPGGRFPSELNVNRDLQVPLSPSSGTSSDDRDAIAGAGALPGSGVPFGQSGHTVRKGEDETNESGEIGGFSRTTSSRGYIAQRGENDADTGDEAGGLRRKTSFEDRAVPGNLATVNGQGDIAPSRATSYRETYIPIAQRQEYNNLPVNQGPNPTTSPTAANSRPLELNDLPTHRKGSTYSAHGAEYNNQPVHFQGMSSEGSGAVSYGTSSRPSEQQFQDSTARSVPLALNRHDSHHGDWIAPAAAGAGGSIVAAAGAETYLHQEQKDVQQQQENTQHDAQITAPTTGVTGNVEFANVAPSPIELDANNSGKPAASTMTPESTTSTMNHPGNSISVSTGTSIPSTVESDAGGNVGSRPTLPSNQSEQTISYLHVPGEYPPTPAAGPISSV